MSAGWITPPSFDVYAEEIDGPTSDPWEASVPASGTRAAVTS